MVFSLRALRPVWKFRLLAGKMEYVLTDEERMRKLTDVYEIPGAESGRGTSMWLKFLSVAGSSTSLISVFRHAAGHYGVVRLGIHRETGGKVAVKSVPKRRAVYVEMLRLEIDVLRVSCLAPPKSVFSFGSLPFLLAIMITLPYVYLIMW